LSGKPQYPYLDAVSNVKAMNFRDITKKDIDWLIRKKPKFMHSTTFTSRAVVHELQKVGREDILKNMTVWWTNENITAHKADVGRLFKDVYQGYGLSELPTIATECKYHNMHVNMEVAVVEIIDNEVVVTNLFNSSMPIIRYKTGDTAKLRRSDCPCGRKSDILYDLEGKTVDYYDGPEVRTPISWLLVSPLKQFIDIIQSWRVIVHIPGREVEILINWKPTNDYEGRHKRLQIDRYVQFVREQTGFSDVTVIPWSAPFPDKHLLKIIK
jgi:phenylacetate-coenzyme A ligase PaaK-like adenylate-forming protein